MTTSIDKIWIYRHSYNSQYSYFAIIVEKNDKRYFSNTSPRLTEEEAVRKITNDFLKDHKSEYYKAKIILGFEELRLRQVTDTHYFYIEIPLLEQHFSCKMKNVVHFTTDLQESEVPQSRLKQKLREVDKDNEVVSFLKTTDVLFVSVATKRSLMKTFIL